MWFIALLLVVAIVAPWGAPVTTFFCLLLSPALAFLFVIVDGILQGILDE